MSLSELKYELLRTPLETPAFRLRHALGYFQRRRHPELKEIYLEESRIREVVRSLLEPTAHCVDIGCHYGSFLSLLCRSAPAGRHVAFEAMPSKVRFLRRKFPEVEVRELALSDTSGRAEFYVNRRATGFSTLGDARGGDFERLEVDCARLDDVLPRDRRFALLKIDVEGAELLVFKGARATLGRDRPVVLFECGPGGPQAFGYQPGDLYDLLTAELGYEVFFPKDGRERSCPASRSAFVDAVSSYPFQAFNWIAFPKGSFPLDRTRARS
jgi:FkbM family methyltransferase